MDKQTLPRGNVSGVLKMIRQGDIPRLAELIFERLKNEGYLDNCTTCMYWNDKTEFCQFWKAKPPAKTIVTGCEEHDIIPF